VFFLLLFLPDAKVRSFYGTQFLYTRHSCVCVSCCCCCLYSTIHECTLIRKMYYVYRIVKERLVLCLKAGLRRQSVSFWPCNMSLQLMSRRRLKLSWEFAMFGCVLHLWIMCIAVYIWRLNDKHWAWEVTQWSVFIIQYSACFLLFLKCLLCVYSSRITCTRCSRQLIKTLRLISHNCYYYNNSLMYSVDYYCMNYFFSVSWKITNCLRIK